MGHEQERLSAYLDDELTPAERAEVTAHLQACADCAARLAELGAVDGALAALSAEAPGGYFEAFPGRLRSRLDAPKRRRLPVWTWAAAAALLLAVVTPLTLRSRHDPEAAREARVEPAAAAPPLASSAPATPPATLGERRDEPMRQNAPAPAEKSLADEKQKAADAERAGSAYGELRKQEREFAPAPRDRDAGADLSALGYVAPATPEAKPSSVPKDSLQAAGAPAPRTQEEDAQAAVPKRDAAAPVATGLSSGDAAGGRGRVMRQGAAGTSAATLLSFESEWQRLETRRPRTPAEWRRLREDWRGFVNRDPEGPLADPARLRMIEAGRAAWQASKDADDEATFREDAEAYLARDTAPQKDRVRQLLLADPSAR